MKEESCCQKVEKSVEIKISSNLTRQQCSERLTLLVDLFAKNLPRGPTSTTGRNMGQVAAERLLSEFKSCIKILTNELYARAEFQTNEGALANVKPTFDGDTTIRKILTENVVQRKHVGLLDNKSEVYLIILHDKQRLSLLGLSSLLSKKTRNSQMTVSKQSSATLSIPVTSLAVSHASANVAVCSLRDVTIVQVRLSARKELCRIIISQNYSSCTKRLLVICSEIFLE